MAAVTLVFAAIFTLLVLIVLLLLWHRRKSVADHKDKIRDLYQEIDRLVESRSVNDPKLIDNKLRAAEEQIAQGKYRKAEKTLRDTRNILLLS